MMRRRRGHGVWHPSRNYLRTYQWVWKCQPLELAKSAGKNVRYFRTVPVVDGEVIKIAS